MAETGIAEIDRLVATLGKKPNWELGFFNKVDLPAEASADQVVDSCLKMAGFSEGHITQHEILKSRKVNIPGSTMKDFTAFLIDSNLGKKIILASYPHKSGGWWTRVYELNKD